METNIKWILVALGIGVIAAAAGILGLPAITNGANDNAAKSVINQVEVAEDTYQLNNGSYATRDELTTGTDPLVKDKGNWAVSSADGRYCVGARSGSGKTFWSYKGANDVTEGSAPDAAPAGVACPTIP